MSEGSSHNAHERSTLCTSYSSLSGSETEIVHRSAATRACDAPIGSSHITGTSCVILYLATCACAALAALKLQPFPSTFLFQRVK